MNRFSVASVLLFASWIFAAGCAKQPTSSASASLGTSEGVAECQGMGGKKTMQGMMMGGSMMRSSDADAGTIGMACKGMAPDAGCAPRPTGSMMGTHDGAAHNCPMGTMAR